MRFEITPLGDNRLPLVREVGNEVVGKLEGYNGVGKTLLAMLLQICTGVQPFVSLDQQARWEGLRAGFGRLAVNASGLRNNRSIRWTIDSRLWPASLAESVEITDAWFDIEIDGERAGLHQVRGLLAVTRVAGNEGLLETLANEADIERANVERYLRFVSSRADALAIKFSELRGVLGPIRPGQFSALRERTREAILARDEARQDSERAQAFLRDVQAGVEARDQLVELETSGPTLEETLATLRQGIASLQRESQDALERIRELSPGAEQSQEASSSLVRANRSLKSATTRLGNTSTELAKAAAEAGLADPSAVETETEAVVAALSVVRSRRKALTKRPEMMELLTQLDTPLRRAQDNHLGDQVVLTDPKSPSRDWRVDEVYQAIGDRRRDIEELPELPEAARAESQVERLTDQLHALRKIPSLRTALDRAERAVRTASQNVQDLNRQASNPAINEIAELQSRLEEINQELVRLGGSEARLQRQLHEIAAGRTVDEARARLAETINRLPSDVTDLDDAMARAVAGSNLREQRLAEANGLAREAASDEALLLDQGRNAVARLKRDPAFEWLAHLSGAVPDVDAPSEHQQALLEALSRALERADQALEQQLAAPGAASYALELIARQLRGTPPTESPPTVPHIRAWLSRQASQWLEEPAVRQFVLPESDGAIEVDLVDRRVVGRRMDGSPISKPLEGFSSGEQAFAFTQAQLARIDRESAPAQERLIILDEFGAFIASEGREQLARQLRRWSSQHPYDQFLIILPTTQDYEALALATVDEAERNALLGYARALAERQYFSAAFDS